MRFRWNAETIAVFPLLWNDATISQRDIARYFGCSVPTVRDKRVALGLPPRRGQNQTKSAEERALISKTLRRKHQDLLTFRAQRLAAKQKGPHHVDT